MASKRKNKAGSATLIRRKDDDEYHDFRGFVRVYFRQLRRYMVTGLMVWVPLIVTLWISWWVISNVGFGLENFFKSAVERGNELGAKWRWLGFLANLEYIRGFGFLITVFLFLSTGFIARYLAGQKIIAMGERLLGMIPFVNRIYMAAQQIRDVFVSRDGTVFQEVVLVEYPRPGLLVVGFVTSREHGIVQKTAARPLAAVFVPTTPNPTSGFLLYVPPEEITPLDITVEDAMKLIVSGGAFLPSKHPEVLRRLEEKQEESASEE